MMSDFILSGRSISKYFGGLQALSMVDFDVESGVIFSIIGPNGAGKTTLFNLVSGFDMDFEGEFIFEDEVISHYPPHTITGKGVARTFQNVRLFKNLTVLENVAVGCHGWVSPDDGMRDLSGGFGMSSDAWVTRVDGKTQIRSSSSPRPVRH